MVSFKDNHEGQSQTQTNDRDSLSGPRAGNCRMISTEFMDPRGKEAERNPKPFEEVKVGEVKLFGEDDDRSVRNQEKREKPPGSILPGVLEV